MSFFKEAYPAVDFDTSDGSRVIPDNWRTKMSCSTQMEGDLAIALKMTPYGMKAFQTVCRALQNYTPPLVFNVTDDRIVDPNDGNAINDQGLTFEGANSIICNLSTFNGLTLEGTRDRFFDWSPPELLNIVGYHEIDHLILNTKTRVLSTDDIECVFCTAHKEVISREFKARIQFSLLYPTISTTKHNWLNGYAFYFEVMYRLIHPIGALEKAVARSYDRSKGRTRRMRVFEASDQFLVFLQNIRDNAIYVNGLNTLFKYYNSTVYELENRFESFISNEDANYTPQVVSQVKSIIDDLQNYIQDQNFDLID